MAENAEKNQLEPPKAAIYVRVSTEEQARLGVSLDAQEEALKGYCKTYGFEIFNIYRDEGKSAKDMAHRPALRQLLTDAEAKKFNTVLVYKLDRFSRSLIDLKLTVEKLKKLKVDFVSMQEKIETNSAAGNLFFNILGSFAEFERQIIGERTKFGMAKKARDGTIVNRAPLGYDIVNKKLVINEKGAELVRQIFNDFPTTKLSLNKFAKKYSFTTRGMIMLLKNQTYLGKIKFAGEWHVGGHTPIIEPRDYAFVQGRLFVMGKKL
jgi:site-specific DNA recombinase